MLNLHEKRENESLTYAHDAQRVTYYILICASVIQSSLTKGKAYLFIKSVNSFINS
jgi:hypothetical protein